MTEENQSDIGQVHAKSVNDPSTRILGFNLWDHFSRLQITRGLGSATRDTSGEGGSHLGGTDTPNEGDKDQGGDDGEDDDNRNSQGAKGKKIQQSNQRSVPCKGILGFNWWDYFSRLQITRGLGSATKDTSGEGGSHLGGTDTPNEGDKDQGGDGGEDDDDGGEDDDNRKGLQILKTTYMEQEQANPFQLIVEATGGAPGIASVKGSVTKPLASTSKLYQRVTEMAHEFISGTRFRANCADKGGPTPKSRYMFKLWPKVPTNKLPNGSDEEKHKGMLCTVSPNFKANWSMMRQDICKYGLKVKRHACELVLVAGKPKTWWGRGKQNLSCDCNKMLQTYRVTLYINHDMSNIETLAEFERPLWKDNPKNKLVGLGVHPSSPASDEAFL
ncbi:unnamed protein product [Sphagnum jensenii]|uniref:Uncharacterized protein n=1 Tax=Sphagnum jensenii TaxID=128206 RepID=A0ABP0WHI7_9BRYO